MKLGVFLNGPVLVLFVFFDVLLRRHLEIGGNTQGLSQARITA